MAKITKKQRILIDRKVGRTKKPTKNTEKG